MNVVDAKLGTKTLSAAVKQFETAIGAAHVITAPADLESYRDPYPFDDEFDRPPVAVVKPNSVEEIQALLRVANETRVPLWVISRGKNLGYGAGTPRTPDAVLLDLGRLNRVLDVDDVSCTALIEPGVTFFDLYQHVRAHNKKVWLSVPGLGWGSVIGNALERGVGYTAYGDHAANQCGLEAVLPNGDVVRTGMGAIGASTAWQLYKPGFGPSHDGLFFQSNLGIVTKMGFWMMPRPETYRACAIKFRDEAVLGPLIDILRGLKLDGTLQSTVMVTSPLHAAAKLSTRRTWWDGEGAVPDAIIRDTIIPKLDIGWWNLAFALYGPEDLADARLRVIERALGTLGKYELVSRTYAGDVSEEELNPSDRIRAGVPGLAALEATKWAGGGGGTIGFGPISPFTGADAVRQYKMVRERGREYGFDYYGSFNCYVRHITHIYQIFFDSHSKRDRTEVAALFRRLVEDAAAHGYCEYRAHLAFMDLIAAQYDFNGHALRRLNETIKDALDPNGILAPGKQGIWPKDMRN